MIAYISQNAFWGLLISAVEVYKRECFGLLIGYRDRRGPDEMYIVEHALPFQSAGRKHRGVVSNPVPIAGSSVFSAMFPSFPSSATSTRTRCGATAGRPAARATPTSRA